MNIKTKLNTDKCDSDNLTESNNLLSQGETKKNEKPQRVLKKQILTKKRKLMNINMINSLVMC